MERIRLTRDELLQRVAPCCTEPRFRFIHGEDGYPMVKCDACGTVGHDGSDERHAVYMWNVERPREPGQTEIGELGRWKTPDAAS